MCKYDFLYRYRDWYFGNNGGTVFLPPPRPNPQNYLLRTTPQAYCYSELYISFHVPSIRHKTHHHDNAPPFWSWHQILTLETSHGAAGMRPMPCFVPRNGSTNGSHFSCKSFSTDPRNRSFCYVVGRPPRENQRRDQEGGVCGIGGCVRRVGEVQHRPDYKNRSLTQNTGNISNIENVLKKKYQLSTIS